MRWSILIATFSCFALLCVIGYGVFQCKSAKTENEYTAEEFLKAGNDYYRRASGKKLPAEEQTDLYKKSVENYRKALKLPGIEEKAKAEVELRIRQIEGLLAGDIYKIGVALVPLPQSDEAMRKVKEKAPEAIKYFNAVTAKFPNTDYADLSYVQLGMCYEYLEKWKEAEEAYEGLIQKYTDEKGNPITPFSENVRAALRYARERLAQLPTKLLALEVNRPLPH